MKIMKRGNGVLIGFLQVVGMAVFLPFAYAQQPVTTETGSVPAQNPSAPVIAIQSPIQNQKVTAPKLLVKGEVADDAEVVSIIIGDVSLGVSGTKIPFQYPVYLKKGKNEIHIEALDNAGNKSEQVLTVYCEGCTEKSEKKSPTPSVAPVKPDKINTAKNKEGAIPSIPDLPSKSIIVKKEDYVKITPTATASVIAETKSETKKVAVAAKKKEMPSVVSLPMTLKKKGTAKVFFQRKKIKKIRTSHRYASYVTITPRIMVNDRSVYVTIKPVIKKGRTYVALEHDLLSKLGATAVHERKGGKQTVYLHVKGNTVKLQAGARTITVNGKVIFAGLLPLRVKGGHLIVPFRTVCEALGFYVHWDPATRTASAYEH